MVALWQLMAPSTNYTPSFQKGLALIIKIVASCYMHITHACRMKAALDELAPGNGIKMKLSEDGSGRGAAIVAAVACRLAAAGEYK